MIDFKDITTLPAPGFNVPCRFAFSPDEKYVSYLFSSQGGLLRDLWVYDPETDTRTCLMKGSRGLADETTLSFEEQMSREREREIGLGVTAYCWSPDSRYVLVESGRELIAVSPSKKRQLWSYKHEHAVFIPTFSPDHHKIAFVGGHDIWCLSPGPEGKPRGSAEKITQSGNEKEINGIAEQHTWEELGRKRGFWWLPDNRHIVFTSVVTGNVPDVYISGSGQTRLEKHPYSFAGGKLPETAIFVADTRAGDTRRLTDLDDSFPYLANVFVHPDGRVLLLKLSRSQRELTLGAIDLDDGGEKILFKETGHPWINVFSDFRFLSSDGSLLRRHERQDVAKIERRDASGNFLYDLAAPDGMVHGLSDIDEENGWVYYFASEKDPRERHFFRSPVDGTGRAEQLTSRGGSHTVVQSHSRKLWIHGYDSIDSPPRVTLERVESGKKILLDGTQDPRIRQFDLRAPEFISFPTEDGTRTLHGAIYRPKNSSEAKRCPLLLSVYGGPHAQAVQNSWALTADMRIQSLTEQGFLVLKVDNRGSWGRGISFEAPVHLKLGQVEIEDQVQGIRYVTEKLCLADPKRVGVFGWSYGGYMSIMCMLKRPDLFKCAVAGAPVIRWEDYDALYTERYMGICQTDEPIPDTIKNETGYKAASVLTHLDNLRGPLLVIHGTSDENVLFRHTLALIREASLKNKFIDLDIIPDERHRVRSDSAREHIERRLFRFFEKALLGSCLY